MPSRCHRFRSASMLGYNALYRLHCASACSAVKGCVRSESVVVEDVDACKTARSDARKSGQRLITSFRFAITQAGLLDRGNLT